MSEDAALEDASYYLTRALEKNLIDIESFLKASPTSLCLTFLDVQNSIKRSIYEESSL